MATISRITTWNSGDTLTASALNGEFNNILNDYNGNITNANIAAAAAIAASKISDTAITQTATQTMSNKTLTKPIIDASVQGIVADTDGATITFNMTSDNVHTVTLGGNRTLAVSNTSVGQFFFIRLLQDGSGSRTVTWFSTITWAGAAAPTLTTTASRADLFAFFTRATDTYDGFVVGSNIG